MSDEASRPVRQRFSAGTTGEDLKAYMAPFVATLGYKFNTEDEFVDEVLASELEILEKTGDVFCPCRIRTGDPKEDTKIVCPCIPFYLEQFAAMRKCWCGLFIRTDVEDGADLIGVIEEPETGGAVDVPVCRAEDLADGQVRHVKIGKRDIVLARVGEEYFALSNLCRHAFGPLSDGILDGYYLMCPWHGWRYDVRDGTTDHPDAGVKTYPALERGGEVLVRVAVR
ncbi:MAG: ferredoxin-thioredoxin reductase catalytic domain-containing protein [Coriobacteriia bacterium]|nr:ferredoxin-thioredoxin reductase catalytic domain-containing protein [Coriobacteriia bacterium]